MKQMLIGRNVAKNNFDLLRFLLATAVIYSHCYVIFYGKIVDTEPFMKFSRNQIDLGGLAVDCFFIISGFLIVRSYERSDFKDYLVNRFLRIYPGFCVAFLISLLVVGPLGTINAAHPFGQWVKYYDDLNVESSLLHLVTLQKPSAPFGFTRVPLRKMVNEPLWTIQYEFLCYLIVPFVAMLGFLTRKWIAFMLFAACYFIVVIQDQAYLLWWNDYDGKILTNPAFLPRFLTYFFSGGLCYLLRERIPSAPVWVFLSVIMLIISCIWVKCINMVMPVCGSYLIFYLAYHPKLPFSNFARKGDYSYGLYLYFRDFKLSPNRLFLLTFPIALAAAFISWNVVEKTFLRLKNRKKVASYQT
jgi:peptidoglycan/LPS O-acetylase OafA/YrhL